MTNTLAVPLPALADSLAYAVRVSARASRIRLRVLPGKGLEVVLPRGVDPSIAAGLVERHKVWIDRTLRRVCPDGVMAEASQAEIVPDAVLLHGGTLRLPVCCAGENALGAAAGATGATGAVDAPGAPGELDAPVAAGVSDVRGAGGGSPAVVKLRARREDAATALRQLRQWLRVYAAQHLARELAALAAEHDFRVTGLRFGCQKSRWGSCTARGAVSLNICLIFLPPELSRHVLLHELAHTRHCNHGEGFWQVLFAAEPEALALDKRLRRAWRHVPAWVWA